MIRHELPGWTTVDGGGPRWTAVATARRRRASGSKRWKPRNGGRTAAGQRLGPVAAAYYSTLCPAAPPGPTGDLTGAEEKRKLFRPFNFFVSSPAPSAAMAEACWAPPPRYFTFFFARYLKQQKK
eukprot:COSAG04_NODE_3975_length_2387_cov_1.486451_2_plen_125_part_00